jgi:thiamine pyrophosphokinase
VRALLVSGSPAGVSAQHLRGLARDAGLVVAVDSGANWTFAAGITPHLIVGDCDSIQASILASYRSRGVEFITLDAHKDQTDLEVALEAIEQRGGEELVACNVLGGRLDHELASLGALARARRLSPVIEEEQGSVYFLGDREGARCELALDGLADTGALVSVIALEESTTVSEQGMEWNLDQAQLRLLDPRGVSNKIKDPAAAKITLTKGQAAIILPK